MNTKDEVSYSQNELTNHSNNEIVEKKEEWYEKIVSNKRTTTSVDFNNNKIKDEVSKKNLKKLDMLERTPNLLKESDCQPYKQLAYISICSSAADYGTENLVASSNSSANTKSSLSGVEDDLNKVIKLFMNLANSRFKNMGKYTFSKESVASIQKNDFFIALKSFFNIRFVEGCILYYTGHGFDNASLLFESPHGNYYVTYEEILEA